MRKKEWREGEDEHKLCYFFVNPFCFPDMSCLAQLERVDTMLLYLRPQAELQVRQFIVVTICPRLLAFSKENILTGDRRKNTDLNN